MRDKPGDIEIQEPPLQELNKKRSCVKRSCGTGCGCIGMFLLATALLLRFATHPPEKKVQTLPSTFPSDIPVYDKDAVQTMYYISGKERNRWVELAGYIPKAVVAPILISLEKNIDMNASSTEHRTSWQEWANILKKPIAEHRDTIRIEWADLSAQPKFIEEYYRTELLKKRYIIANRLEKDSGVQFSFEKNGIDGVVTLKDDPKKNGTDEMILSVNVPIQ